MEFDYFDIYGEQLEGYLDFLYFDRISPKDIINNII